MELFFKTYVMTKEGIFVNGYIKVNGAPIECRIKIVSDVEKASILKQLGITESELVTIQGVENTYFDATDKTTDLISQNSTVNADEINYADNISALSGQDSLQPTTDITNNNSAEINTASNTHYPTQTIFESSNSSNKPFNDSLSTKNLSGNDNQNFNQDNEHLMGGGSSYSHNQQPLNVDTSASLVFEAFGLNGSFNSILNSNIKAGSNFSAEFVALAGTNGNSVIIDIEGGSSDGIIINIPSLISGIDAQFVTEDVSLNGSNIEISGSLTISDPNGDNSFAIGTYNGLYGSITMGADGNWTYTADNYQSSIQSLGAGATLTDTITIVSADGTAHDINITIQGTNDAAVISGVDTGAVIEDTGVVGNNISTSGILTVTDIDTGEALFTAGTHAGTYGSVTIDAAGNWTYTADNTNVAIQSLGAGSSLAESISITSLDGTTHNISLTINGTNDAAVISGVDTGAVTEVVGVVGNYLNTTGAMTISDADTGESSFNAGTYSGTYGSATLDAAGNWTYTADNSQYAIQTLQAGSSITDNITVTSVDGTTHNISLVLNGQGGSTIYGTAGNDTLNGGAGDDVIVDLQGDNTINAGSGNDIIFSDLSLGYSWIYGGAGVDTVSYEKANIASGGIWIDIRPTTGWANNGVDGGNYLNSIENVIGSNKNDTFLGNSADNIFMGGLGNDYLRGALGNNTLDGGAGVDVVSYSDATGGITIDLSISGAQNTGGAGVDTISNIENILGSQYNDIFTGDAGDNKIEGLGGNDALEGGLGNNIIDGGTGSDSVLYLGATSGVTVDLSITGAQDTIGAGTDTIVNVENIQGSSYGDILTGDAGANRIYSFDGDDTVYGGSGDDILNGGLGNDILDGGAGNDTLDGSTGIDTVSYSDATTAVTVDLSNTAAQNTGGAGTDTITNVENIQGSSYNDTLAGDAGSNAIDGGAGADTLSGGAGDDSITFDIADLLIDGGAGNDALVVNDTNVDFTAASTYGIVSNMETIDLNNALGQTINLDVTSVQQMTELQNDLYVQGDTGDTVNLTGFTDTTSDVTVNGITYSHYSDGSGTDVYVDNDSMVNLL